MTGSGSRPRASSGGVAGFPRNGPTSAAASALLARVPLFEGLPADAVERLAAASTFRRFRAGQQVFFQGDVADAMYVVASGRLKVAVSSVRGDELVLAVLTVGDAVGELGALDGMKRSAGVEALADAELLRIDAAVVNRLLRTYPRFAEALTLSLCRLVRHLTGSSADLAFVDAPGRLARLLLELADSTGRAVVDLGLTQAGVASRIGTSRQTVNETLHTFQRRGWVQLRGREVLILEPDALRRYAER